jgi:hypothetical protein
VKTKEEKAIAMREYRKNNPEKIRATDKKKRDRNKDSIRLKNKEWRLKAYYGITIKDFSEMMENQNGKCYICKVDSIAMKKGLVVDHCHKSGKARKLLCQNCNSLLGMSKENIETLELAIEYLKEHK